MRNNYDGSMTRANYHFGLYNKIVNFFIWETKTKEKVKN